MSSTRRPRICILNSSSFGKHHSDHISKLESFALLSRVDVDAAISAEDLLKAVGQVDAIIASVTPRLTSDFLLQQPDLRIVARHGIGCDNVDVAKATELGILVTNVEGVVERDSVAELAVALATAVARHVPQGAECVKQGRWAERSRFIGPELTRKTAGIIGLGNIGSRSAEILAGGFQCRVLAYDPYIPPENFVKFLAQKCGLEELLAQSDFVFLHCPLTKETRRMLGRERLAGMKKGAIIVNTCRGELLDEDALVEALKSGQLRGYGTDVVEGEPIDGTHRLLHLPGVVVLPHLGGYSFESLRGMGDTMVNDCMSVFVDKSLPKRVYNPEVLKNPLLRRWM